MASENPDIPLLVYRPVFPACPLGPGAAPVVFDINPEGIGGGGGGGSFASYSMKIYNDTLTYPGAAGSENVLIPFLSNTTGGLPNDQAIENWDVLLNDPNFTGGNAVYFRGKTVQVRDVYNVLRTFRHRELTAPTAADLYAQCHNLYPLRQVSSPGAIYHITIPSQGVIDYFWLKLVSLTNPGGPPENFFIQQFP